MSWAGSIALPVPRRGRFRVLWRRGLAVGIAAAALAAAYVFWFRDSSLVAVKTVQIEGVSKENPDLVQALEGAGREMTTLHVDEAALVEAARPFALVASVHADPALPNTLKIEVTERRPAALIGADSDAVAVADDGAILRGVPISDLELPRLPLSTPPRKSRLAGPLLEQVEVLGATPAPLRPHVEESFDEGTGPQVLLEGGVVLRFGDAARAEQKWRAAASVLSDPELGALDYVDLTVPRRPAVGGSSYAPPQTASG